MKPLVGILIFSAIETVTVIAWFALVMAGRPLVAAIVLFVGYVIEHIVAFNVGKGRPILSAPRNVVADRSVPPA
jgi:hypothetical protein